MDDNDENIKRETSAVGFKYRRRLDRSPDVHFQTLGTEDKILLSTLRGTLEEAKQRIVRLRDENDDKADIIEEERKLRVEAEVRLSTYLTDMYGSSDVNDELRHRLPRAKKVDPLQHILGPRGTELNDENDAGSESSNMERTNGEKDNRAGPPAVHLADISSSDAMAANTGAAGVLSGGPPATSGSAQLTQTHPGPQSSLLYHPHSSTLAAASLSSMASTSYQGLPHVSAAMNMGDTPSKAQDLNPSQPQQEALSTPAATASYQSLPGTQAGGSFPQQNFTAPLFNNPATINCPAMNQIGSNTPTDRLDNVSHISRLLAEIATLKKENEQTRSDLKDTQRDLAVLKAETQSDIDRDFEDIGAEIEAIHAAEKVRDRAAAQVVRGAEEDRNAALSEVERLRLKSGHKNKTFHSLSEVPDTLLEDDDVRSQSSESSIAGPRSWQHVEELLGRQREVMQREMAVVIQQRDAARAQVDRLEAKLSSVELPKFTGVDSNKLMAKLKVAEQERDLAVTKLKLVTQEANNAVLHSLRKGLLSEDSANDLSSHRDKSLESGKSSNVSVEQTRQLEDKAKLEAKVAILEKKNSATKAENSKLKELVKQQRQKLNTLCAGPLLIEKS